MALRGELGRFRSGEPVEEPGRLRRGDSGRELGLALKGEAEGDPATSIASLMADKLDCNGSENADSERRGALCSWICTMSVALHYS